MRNWSPMHDAEFTPPVIGHLAASDRQFNEIVQRADTITVPIMGRGNTKSMEFF